MILAAIGLCLPSLSMWYLLRASGLARRVESAWLRVALAVALGIGVSSVTTFLLVSGAGLRLDSAYVGLDALMWVGLGALSWRQARGARRVTSTEPDGPGMRWSVADWLALGGFGVVAAGVAAAVFGYYMSAPHGEWDAWAIWNQRARFLARAGQDWTVVRAIPWSNPSHPLLVSVSVARLWAYAGQEVTSVPALLSATYGALIVMAIVGAFTVRQVHAWVAGAVVMAPVVVTQLWAAQTADLPTGLYILLSTIMLRGERGADLEWRADRLCAAGVLASLAAWTKNEGAVFFLASSLVLVPFSWRSNGLRYGWWLAGGVPVLVTLLWFKLAVAPSPPLYMAEPLTAGSLLAQLADPDEHAAVWSVIGLMFARWGGTAVPGGLLVAIAATAVAARRRLHARFVWAVSFLMMAGYYAVWIVSPLDTAWLASMTFDRLVAQLWPVLVLAAFSLAEADEPPGAKGMMRDLH